MGPLAWILTTGILMSAIALVGGLTLLFSDDTLDRLLLPLVGLAAGSLLGGAAFHMLPAGLDAGMDTLPALTWFVAGFTLFFVLEQVLHRHHCRGAAAPCRQPVTYLILIGDGLHNFLGGLAVGGAFVLNTGVGLMTWLAAAAHEVPQELGDFGVLVAGGWEKKRALAYNFLSGLSFPVGGLVAYAMSFQLEVRFLLPFAAGNFVYIAASDLIPEANRSHERGEGFRSLVAFAIGLGILYALAVWGPAHA